MVQCRLCLTKANKGTGTQRCCGDLRKRLGVDLLPDRMRASAVVADHCLANLGRDREVGQMSSNRYDHLSPLPAGFQMLQNSSQLIAILPSRPKILDIQEDDQATSSDPDVASHSAFLNIWLRVADIFTPFSQDTPSTTGYRPHHATHHRSSPHPAFRCRAT